MAPSPDTSGALLAQWSRRFAEPVAGWSFSGFADVVTTSDPPWSCPALAREVLRGATSVLDLGTGGGEFLRTLADALPADTHATEGWPTNLPVARAALSPLGVEVTAHDPAAGPLPFPDNRFDVVLSRHAAYDAADVARVLRPGGTLLTQQARDRRSRT